MHKDLLDIHKHMQLLGRSSLAHALTLIIAPTNEGEYGYYGSELAVLIAAHAAEILLKSRIAEEHPLLIFSQIPKSKESNLLEIKALFESGRTIQYQDIPERLWATTGYKLKRLDLYEQFGKLRNNIQHFAPPKSDNFLTQATLEFIFKVIDPCLQDFWGGHAVTCLEYPEHSSEYLDLFHRLFFWEIDFKYPEKYEKKVGEARKNVKSWSHRGKDVLAQEELVKGDLAKYTIQPWPEVWSKKRTDENSTSDD